jgi:L-seryl-tRNA(Ser) seleniumtransferase
MDQRRRVPRTDTVLADPRLAAPTQRLGAAAVKAAVVAAQERIRRGELDPDDVVEATVDALPRRATTLRPVINATGVVLHTNLGRAPLSGAAVAAVVAAAGYVDVEFDVHTGERAQRGDSCLAALRTAVGAAEDALVVNNGAAALVLAVTALAAGREVVISRGELVEIGAGFRLPELIESTGARIREVGTTNRVQLSDYAAAIGPGTGCVVKVHPSNFRIEGFTAAVSVAQLAPVEVPVVADIGSGLLHPDPLLPDEPDVTSMLRQGASVVTCSGDKLLGGPQAGLAFGAAPILHRMRRHPLARALRVDKLTLAALEATVRGPITPTSHYLHADPAALRRRCERLAAALGGEVVASAGTVGGGGAPGLRLDGWALALPAIYAEALRTGDPSVIGRMHSGRYLIDLRCVPEIDDDTVLAAVKAVQQ